MNRNNHGMHMHTYKGSANIHACGGTAPKILNHNVIIKTGNGLQCKSAARMKLGLYPNLLKVIFFHAFSLNY